MSVMGQSLPETRCPCVKSVHPSISDMMRCKRRERRNGAMCGRPGTPARAFFTSAVLVGAAMCSASISAVHVTAGHNALRGSGPGQRRPTKVAAIALALVGCPDRRIDRHRHRGYRRAAGWASLDRCQALIMRSNCSIRAFSEVRNWAPRAATHTRATSGNRLSFESATTPSSCSTPLRPTGATIPTSARWARIALITAVCWLWMNK